MRNALLLFCFLANIVLAQTPPQRVLGELTGKDPAAKTLTIKADNGSSTTVAFTETTSFLRVPPGETSLTKAVKIQADDLAVGDRVLASGTAPAQRVIVMTKSDLTQKQAAERAEWQQRGVAGTVVAVDPAGKQLSVKRRALGGETTTLTIETTDKTQFRRYAPDSVKFSDAKPSSLTEILNGDQVRVLGDKPLEGTKLTAEVVVSGSFRNIAATVLSVDAAAGEMRVTDLETKKPVTVKVNADSMLRRIPPMMAQRMAARFNGATAGAPGGQGAAGERAPGAGAPGERAPGADAAGPGFRRPGGGAGPGPNGAGGQGPGGMEGRPRGGDMQSMLDRMPALQLSELKAGDALVINSTSGAQAGRVTAISVLAGVEPFLTAPTPQGDRRLNGAWNMGDINIMP